ncbi:MAG: TrmH family RNA methyltransferase [Spirochaetaceae bacterium]|nr:MAG: TrmH family RNA methyltransferase [Spirochaetaceae bacterium]
MITIRKLSELPPKTRLRKISRLARLIEYRLRGLPTPQNVGLHDDHSPPDSIADPAYVEALFRLAADEPKLPADFRARLAEGGALARNSSGETSAPLIRALNDLHHGLEAHLGRTVADWDFFVEDGLDSGARTTLPLYLYLDDLRSPFNVGAIFRAADAFGVREIFLSPGCADPTHPRAARASMGAVAVIPWKRLEIDAVVEAVGVSLSEGVADPPTAALPVTPPETPRETALFAVETGGTELSQFLFPHVGVAILGSEELGVGPQALAMADHSSGRVSIPMAGAKGSLNVGVAAGIVLYQWWRAISNRAPG